MLQSEHFESGHNSTTTKGRQKIKLLWLPVILGLLLTYWGLIPGGTVGAPLLCLLRTRRKLKCSFPCTEPSPRKSRWLCRLGLLHHQCLWTRVAGAVPTACITISPRSEQSLTSREGSNYTCQLNEGRNEHMPSIQADRNLPGTMKFIDCGLAYIHIYLVVESGLDKSA